MLRRVEVSTGAVRGAKSEILDEYIFERLAEANAQQKRAPLEEAIRLLSTLYEGWQQAKPRAENEPVRANSLPPDQIDDEGGRAWTL